MKTLLLLAAIFTASIPASASTTWRQQPGYVLGPTLAWEEDAVQEPSVIYDKKRGVYRLWYSGGGYGRCYTGYAASRDLTHWAKSERPVLGGGNGGERGNACHSNVQYLNGRYWAWYSNDTPGAASGDLQVAVSRDGVKWVKQPRPAIREGGWARTLANTYVIRSNNRWLMFWEAQSTTEVGLWEMATATSTDLIHWKVDRRRIASLGFGESFGGPWLMRENGGWAMYYHAATPIETPGVFSLVYKATSDDLRTWTTERVPLVTLEQDWQVDQVADASVVKVDGRTLMFFDGLDNKVPLRSRIGLAVAGI